MFGGAVSPTVRPFSAIDGHTGVEMGRAKQIDRHRPHWGIVLVTLALFLWGCTTPGVPTHLENQGWRLATLWAVRPAAEFKVPAATLDCRRPEDTTAPFALTSYRSNHRGWILLLPAGTTRPTSDPRFVLVRPGSCEVPIEQLADGEAPPLQVERPDERGSTR